MEKEKIIYFQNLNTDGVARIKDALTELDHELIDAEGIKLKLSQCYYFGTNPLHVLFNTNCPDSLRKKVQDIISLHFATNRRTIDN